MSKSKPKKRIAVFIDSDNVNAHAVAFAWTSIQMMGHIVIARAYGKWIDPKLSSVKPVLSHLSIQRINQENHGKCKNSTDMALSIDATECYLTTPFDIAVIMSGDCDFTPLADWFKRKGVFVVGVGMTISSQTFADVCDMYLKVPAVSSPEAVRAIELMSMANSRRAATTVNVPAIDFTEKTAVTTEPKFKTGSELVDALFERIKATDPSLNPILLSRVGEILREIDPNYSAENYGFNKTTEFLRSFKWMTVRSSAMGYSLSFSEKTIRNHEPKAA